MSNQDDTSLPPLQDDGNNQALSDDDSQQIAVPVSTPATTSHPAFNQPIDVPEEAADVDLIEKEWVVKAKQIVEQTSENPHRQQEEIAKMKTEYIKKRYKRDLDL